MKDIRIICRLDFNQKAGIKEENESSDEIIINKEVSQGCMVSPVLLLRFEYDIVLVAKSRRSIKTG